MRSVLSWLGFASDDAASHTDTIHRIAAELDRLPPDRARYIAAVAYVLSRIARADHEVSAEETAAMERLVAEKNHLPADQAALIVQMAKTQQLLFGGTDDFIVTRELARIATGDEKIALIECLFAVAAADRRIANVEADEIARIGRELKVDQADLSRLRSRFREFLAARQGWESNES
jgi:uncharacterized tellurite resistance protein B-like protein